MKCIAAVLTIAAILAVSGPSAGQEPDVAKTTSTGSKPTGLFVFISASIPEASLVEIAKDAAPMQAPLVLRGLVGESLQETLARMQPLVSLGAALEIDPLLFEAYGIERAPAVVLTCGARGEGPYALVYGIAPSQALPILRRMLRCS